MLKCSHMLSFKIFQHMIMARYFSLSTICSNGRVSWHSQQFFEPISSISEHPQMRFPGWQLDIVTYLFNTWFGRLFLIPGLHDKNNSGLNSFKAQFIFLNNWKLHLHLITKENTHLGNKNLNIYCPRKWFCQNGPFWKYDTGCLGAKGIPLSFQTGPGFPFYCLIACVLLH